MVYSILFRDMIYACLLTCTHAASKVDFIWCPLSAPPFLAVSRTSFDFWVPFTKKKLSISIVIWNISWCWCVSQMFNLPSATSHVPHCCFPLFQTLCRISRSRWSCSILAPYVTTSMSMQWRCFFNKIVRIYISFSLCLDQPHLKRSKSCRLIIFPLSMHGLSSIHTSTTESNRVSWIRCLGFVERWPLLLACCIYETYHL